MLTNLATVSPIRIFVHSLILGSIIVLVGGLLASVSISHAEDESVNSEISLQNLRVAPHRVIGVEKGDCKKCHPSEVATWMKTVHFQSADLRLLSFTGNTKKYAEALKINEADLMGNSLCADCHATKSVVNGQTKVISGVSCESCHGASGGDNGWLNRHQSYHAMKTIPRDQETDQHKKSRFADCEQSGKLLAKNMHGLARNCLKCHLIDNEKLIAAGHKAASAFDFVAWSEGEVRHNFHLNKDVNADAPTLWLEETKSTAKNRRRLKFVLGAMTQLESALRRRADLKNAAVIPQMGGIAAAANGKIAQINGVAGTDETRNVSKMITPLLGLLFAAQPNDHKTYNDIADKIALEIKAFAKNHDGSKLQGLDPLIKGVKPHFSEQYKKKYGAK